MEPNQLYQFSIMNALMAGVADSGITVSDFVKKGNQGVGTFAEIRGELILLDGVVYRMEADGSTKPAEQQEQLPYAVATHFKPEKTTRLVLSSKASVEEALRKHGNAAGNLFLSFRITGKFTKLRCRTVRGQTYKGQPLGELGDAQAEHTYHDIEGTIVGIRSPKAWQGVSVAGEHMHFIDDAREKGGHILELCSDGKVELGLSTINNVHIELPTSKSFNDADMATDDSGLSKVEG